MDQQNIAFICSIKKNISTANIKTIEAELSKQGHARFPGTGVRLAPDRDKSGRYKTGLDPEAEYISHMGETEAAIERKRVTEWRLQLQKALGFTDKSRQMDEDYGLGPFSEYYTRMFENDFYGTSKVAQPALIRETTVKFDLDTPLEKLMYSWLRVHRRVAPSYQHYRNGSLENVDQILFYVKEPELENQLIYEEETKINKAIAILTQLDETAPSELARIARLLGLPVSDRSSKQEIYKLVNAYIKQGDVKEGEYKGRKAIQVFMELTSSKKDNLEVKDIVKQAIAMNAIRREGKTLWIGEKQIGKNEKEVVEFFLTPDGQEYLLAVKAEINAKTSIGV